MGWVGSYMFSFPLENLKYVQDTDVRLQRMGLKKNSSHNLSSKEMGLNDVILVEYIS